MPDNGRMTTTEPRVEIHLSYRSRKVAERRAREWANLNSVVGDREVEVGEVFEVRTRQGGDFVTYWLRYDVTNDGMGNNVISSTRWYTNPNA